MERSHLESLRSGEAGEVRCGKAREGRQAVVWPERLGWVRIGEDR